MAVKLQPPSGSELPAFNPILPPAAVTQILLLANPNKVNQDCGGMVISSLVLMSESYLVFCQICLQFFKHYYINIIAELYYRTLLLKVTETVTLSLQSESVCRDTARSDNSIFFFKRLKK